MDFSDDELMRYSRHLLLDGFGIEGQISISNSKVIIIGCGGLGHPVSFYLAAAGVGSLCLYDADKVEISNLQRQIAFTTEDIHQPKAQALKSRLAALNPDININFRDLAVSSDLDAVETDWFKTADLIIDCSDNFETRYLMNRLSLQYKVPLIMGAAVEYQGLAALFNATADSPCYACVFDEDDQPPERIRCSEAGVFAPLLGIVGSTLASMALQALLKHQQPLKLYSWDLKQHSTRQSNIEKNLQCCTCRKQQA